MEFCEKCGGVLIPRKSEKTTILECRKCGKRRFVKKGNYRFRIASEREERKTVVVEEKVEVLPRTRIRCPKCEHDEAFWWMQQTRSADEPPTRFFRCAKCGHTWREYQ